MVILLIILIVVAISLGIFSLFVATATVVVKKIWLSNKKKSQNTQHTNYYYTPQYHREAPKKDKKIYSPTGWVWNENTKLWEPPDFISEDPILIKRRNSNQPSYEEWKAQRENQNQ